jgi:putative restriction endonuclease
VDGDQDERLRATAFAYLSSLTARSGGVVTRAELESFMFEGARFPLIERQRGIRKAAGFDAAVSLMTTFVTRPDLRPYDDWIDENEYVHYKWKGTNPNSFDNRAVRTAMQRGKPLIYLVGVAPGVYQPLFPAWVVDEDLELHEFIVAADEVMRDAWSAAPFHPADVARHREYVERVVKRRLHQPYFRRDVIAAYTTRCSMCRLRHPELLDAAHIKRDVDGGEPVVTNGLAMCAIHHRAFDAHLLGIRADYVVEVRKSVLQERDGPTSLYALQGLHQAPLAVVPSRSNLQPDRLLLEERYERFRLAG